MIVLRWDQLKADFMPNCEDWVGCGSVDRFHEAFLLQTFFYSCLTLRNNAALAAAVNTALLTHSVLRRDSEMKKFCGSAVVLTPPPSLSVMANGLGQLISKVVQGNVGQSVVPLCSVFRIVTGRSGFHPERHLIANWLASTSRRYSSVVEQSAAVR